MSYQTTPLRTQLEIMKAENLNAYMLDAKAKMWTAAATEIDKTARSLDQETKRVEPAWQDAAGVEFFSRARDTTLRLNTWTENINSSNVANLLQQLVTQIPKTLAKVQEQIAAYDAYVKSLSGKPYLSLAPGTVDLEAPFRVASGVMMDKITALYEQAANAVQTAGGGPAYQGVNPDNKQGTGTQGTGTQGTYGQGTDGPNTGPQDAGQQDAGAEGAADPDMGAQATAAQDGGAQGGAQDVVQDAGLQDGLDETANPALSGGLGGAPVTPPVTPPQIPTLPQTGAGFPVGGAGLPLIPPVVPVTGAGLPGGAFLPAGGGAGTGRGGGVGGRIPGVSLGGAGTSQIPMAANLYEPPTAAAASGPAPTVAEELATAAGTSSPVGGGGGVPPMMPPMGVGGGAGGPGSGAAARPTGTGRRRRKDRVTPGLPAVLSGKAGRADLYAFAGHGRWEREESDVPSTVQLVDEDLWQVGRKPTADESALRRAH